MFFHLRCLSEGKLLSMPMSTAINTAAVTTTLTATALTAPSTPTTILPPTNVPHQLGADEPSYMDFQSCPSPSPPPPPVTSQSESLYSIVLKNPPKVSSQSEESLRKNLPVSTSQSFDCMRAAKTTLPVVSNIPRHSTTNDLSNETALNMMSDLPLSEINTPTSVESMPLMTYPTVKSPEIVTFDEGYGEESYATIRRNDRAATNNTSEQNSTTVLQSQL